MNLYQITCRNSKNLMFFKATNEEELFQKVRKGMKSYRRSDYTASIITPDQLVEMAPEEFMLLTPVDF